MVKRKRFQSRTFWSKTMFWCQIPYIYYGCRIGNFVALKMMKNILFLNHQQFQNIIVFYQLLTKLLLLFVFNNFAADWILQTKFCFSGYFCRVLYCTLCQFRFFVCQWNVNKVKRSIYLKTFQKKVLWTRNSLKLTFEDVHLT